MFDRAEFLVDEAIWAYREEVNYKQRKTMQIQVVSTSVETKQGGKSSYQQLEVVYKNLTYQGKVESKKLMSFGANASAFKTLSAASAGQTFEVTVVKNAQGYNDWTAVSASEGAAVAAAAPGKSSPAPKSTYETPEERAQRQILIVRQSSLSSAVATLTPGAKTALKPEEVIHVAKLFENYVFGIEAFAKASPGATGFDDFPDSDIPFVE